MCIAFFTSKHPDYALVLIDNRDEYILRPTSRPHWWTHPSTGQQVLSSRDLERPERGTWLGVTKTGLICVLTNYREPAQSPVAGRISRGAMVTNWLGQKSSEPLAEDIKDFLAETDVRGSGGFSMLVGKLRQKGNDFAILSNRAGSLEDVPLLNLDERDGGWGLTNTAFDRSAEWEKVVKGTATFDHLIQTHGREEGRTEEDLVERLFAQLSVNTLGDTEGKSLMEALAMLKTSVFIPALGDEKHKKEMEEARAKGKGEWWSEDKDKENAHNGDEHLHPHGEEGFSTGMYGTQRQSVVLVGKDGTVTFIERALWDSNGNEIPRGQGDLVHRFKIDAWEDS